MRRNYRSCFWNWLGRLREGRGIRCSRWLPMLGNGCSLGRECVCIAAELAYSAIRSANLSRLSTKLTHHLVCFGNPRQPFMFFRIRERRGRLSPWLGYIGECGLLKEPHVNLTSLANVMSFVKIRRRETDLIRNGTLDWFLVTSSSSLIYI